MERKESAVDEEACGKVYAGDVHGLLWVRVVLRLKEMALRRVAAAGCVVFDRKTS